MAEDFIYFNILNFNQVWGWARKTQKNIKTSSGGGSLCIPHVICLSKEHMDKKD